jgi:hypothetical protein
VKELGRDVKVTVVDPTGMHVYQPGFLYVALGQANGRWLARDERTLLRRDVDLAVERAVRIRPDAGTVELERGGSLDWDYLVIATGARLVPDAVPGLAQGAHGFYSLEGAQRLREALRTFRGGRIRVGIAGIPYKCPLAPVEFVLMLEGYLRKRGVRKRSEITLLSPLNRAFTIESASKQLLIVAWPAAHELFWTAPLTTREWVLVFLAGVSPAGIMLATCHPVERPTDSACWLQLGAFGRRCPCLPTGCRHAATSESAFHWRHEDDRPARVVDEMVAEAAQHELGGAPARPSAHDDRIRIIDVGQDECLGPSLDRPAR